MVHRGRSKRLQISDKRLPNKYFDNLTHTFVKIVKLAEIVKLWRGYSTAGENRPWIELLEMRGTVAMNDATAEHMRRIYTRDSRDFSGAPASGAAVSAAQPTPRLAYETRHATRSEQKATNTERKLLPAV